MKNNFHRTVFNNAQYHEFAFSAGHTEYCVHKRIKVIVSCCETVRGMGGSIFIFGSITMRCHPIYYSLNAFSAAHMSPVVRNGTKKFVDVLASNSTFEKGYHNDLNYYYVKFTSTVWC